jgi:hypothetical protein
MVGALLAVAFQTLVGWVVAIRLLLLAARTQAVPERLLGGSLLLTVALGYPMRIAGPQLGSAALDWVGNASVSLGFWLFCLFVRRVFRPSARWALALVAVLGLGFAVQAALCSGERAQAATFGQMLLAIVGYGWAALEGVAHARKQSRQRALGLGDAEVHARVRAFAVLGASVVLGATTNASAIALGLGPLESPGVMLATTLSGTTGAVAMLLAFGPPRS